MLASSAPHFTVDGIAEALVGAPVPPPKMTTLNINFSADNGVLRTDDQLLVLLGLARSEFDRGLGQHMDGRKSAPDYVVYGPVSVLLWGQRFSAGVRFFNDVVHGVTLTLEQSKVAALGYGAMEKDLLVEKKTLTTVISKHLACIAFIDITRRRCVRVPLGRRSFESRSEVDVVRYRGLV